MSLEKNSATEDTLGDGLETLSALKDKLLNEQNFDDLKGVVEDLAKDAAEVVRKYPGRSLAGAFVAGVLLGSWLNRK